MSRHKVLYYLDESDRFYKLVKRKSIERKRVLYKSVWSQGKGTFPVVVKDNMSAREAEAFIKLLGLRLYRRS